MFLKTIDKREIFGWGSESVLWSSYGHCFASHTGSGDSKEQSNAEGPAVVIPAYGNAGKCEVKIKSLEIQADLESRFSNLSRVLTMSASHVC